MDRKPAENARQLGLFADTPSETPAPLHRVALAGGRIVEYRFERRRRRTIGIRVDASGVAVSAPRRTPWREIEKFLRSSERWLLARLDEWTQAGKPARLRGASGEALPLFGRTVTLEVRHGGRAVIPQGGRLLIEHPEPSRHDEVRELLVRWLKGRALDMLTPRVAHYAARLGVPMPTVALSNARTQWGVCTDGGRLRLSWRLVHFDPTLADYVVAHEAAHLVEMNHSKRFWKVVEALYPDWRAARKAIELAGAALPIL
jgi:predicted metal-dependent hydrolase